MNTINASSRLIHFHPHRGDDAHGHDHVRAYDRVHVCDHGYVRARAHRLHGNVHDELYLKAV